MESVKCLHRENIESTPALPGIEIGACSKCGQTIQYDHNGMKTKVTVTRLGRLNGNIVLPKHGLQLLLSDVDRNDLKTVLSASKAEPEPAPVPRKHKRERREEYWEQNRFAITEDYYVMTLVELYKKWGLSSNLWKRLRIKWEVAPKGPVNRYTSVTKKTVKARPKSRQALPEFPTFNEGWPPAVKVEWIRTYKELWLAIGEK